MKKLLKKNKPTKAEYFKSESQRKRSNRLAFIYGHKPLVAALSVLIVFSAVIGLVIVQKSRDSHALSNSISWNKNDANTAIGRWQADGTPGFTDYAEVSKSDSLVMSLKSGPVYPDGYQVCWKMVPGGVEGATNFRFTSVDFNYYTNEAGANGVTIIIDGQPMRIDGGQPHHGGANYIQNVSVDLSVLPGGGMQLGQTIKFCNYKIGTGKLLEKKTVSIFAYSFRASYDTPDPLYEILGTVTDNSGSHKAIAGVEVSNCQTTTRTDSGGMFRFMVPAGSYYCVRTQGGLDPNTYVAVKAINENKGAINVGRSADGSSYENQHATGRSTNYDFWAVLNPAFATPTTPCTATGNGNPIQVEAENAICSNGGSSVTDETANQGKAASLKSSGANVQYTFTAPTKGLYQAVARIRNTTSTQGKVNIDYKKLNTGASDIFSQGGKAITGTGYVNYTVKNSAGTVQTHCLEANQKAFISVLSQSAAQVYVDTISLVRSGDCPSNSTGGTGGSTGAGTSSGSSGEKTSNPACDPATQTGLPSPVTATEGIKSGTAINTTLQGNKAVFLQKDGEYVQCIMTLPAGAEAGGYVLAYNGTASVGPGQSAFGTGSPSGDYKGTSIRLYMSGGSGGTQDYTKSAGIVSNGTFAVDRMPIIRKTSSDKPTVRFIQPGEKVLVRAYLVRPTSNNGQLYIQNLQFFKDPCMDTNGNVLQNGQDVGGGITCDPPKSSNPAPANPAPATTTGDASAAAAAIAAAAKCTNNGTGERLVEAEKSVCVPNASNPATVVSEGTVRAVALRNPGQYVEFSFKNNKAPGKYRAMSIIKSTGGSPYVIYHLTKERPGAVDTTTAQAMNVPTSFKENAMDDSAKYIDLTKEEIAQGVTLKVRVTFTKVIGAYGPGSSATIFVDKIGIDRVGDVTTATKTTQVVAPSTPRPATGSGGSTTSPSPNPSPSSSTTQPRIVTTTTPPNFTANRVIRTIGGPIQVVTDQLHRISRPQRDAQNACSRSGSGRLLNSTITANGVCIQTIIEVG